jgi:hypothetical protein
MRKVVRSTCRKLGLLRRLQGGSTRVLACFVGLFPHSTAAKAKAGTAKGRPQHAALSLQHSLSGTAYYLGKCRSMQSSSGWNPSKKWLHTAHRARCNSERCILCGATASVASRKCHVAWCRCDCEAPRACRLRDARRTCRRLALHGALRCALVKPGALQIVHVLYVARCSCALFVARCMLHVAPVPIQLLVHMVWSV